MVTRGIARKSVFALHGDTQLTAVGRSIRALYLVLLKRFSSTSRVSASKTEVFPVEPNGRKELQYLLSITL